MKLKELIKKLQAIKELYGDDLTVVYAGDDEGNYYREIIYTPQICNFQHGEVDFEIENSPNAVCVN